MDNHHSHLHSCTHCACNNPVLNMLKEDIFHQKNFEALPTAKKKTEEQPLNLMVSGGTIRPMIGGSTETVPSIGMAAGKVVVTGTEKMVKDHMQKNHPGYSHMTLKHGQTLLPGLIEPHVHIVPTSLMAGWMNLGPFENNGQNLSKIYGIESVKSAIKDKIAHTKNIKTGTWILGFGIDPALMPFVSKEGKDELTVINVDVLDTITKKHPLMILSASMHTLYLNTLAMEAVFNQNSKTSLKHYHSAEEYIEKTQGQLQEGTEMNPALQTIPKDQIHAMLLESFTHFESFFYTANKRGVTFLYDAGMETNLKKLLEAYLLLHPRTIRIGAAQICSAETDMSKFPKYTLPEEYTDVYIGNVKVVSDGSNQGLTGYQSEPYSCAPEKNYGIFNFKVTKLPHKTPAQTPPSDYQKLLSQIIVTKGWPLMVHANGNQAVDYAIQVFQSLLPENLIGMRHRIEHCSIITDTQLDIMKELEVSPSFLIGHVGYWGHAFQKVIFGEKKTELLDRCHSALKRGMRITLHSDNQVTPLGPLRMMEQSITRKMEADPANTVLNHAECINPEQALVAATYDAAWQCYADKWVGSLELGKFADFVVLADDPIKMADPFMKMRDIEVIETWVGGHKVYPKPLSIAKTS